MGYRIALRTSHSDNGDAIEELATQLEDEALVLPAEESIPVGAWVAFEVALRDGSVVIEGMGRCQATEPNGAGFQVMLGALQLDAANDLMFERILLAHEDRMAGGRATGTIDLKKIAGLSGPSDPSWRPPPAARGAAPPPVRAPKVPAPVDDDFDPESERTVADARAMPHPFTGEGTRIVPPRPPTPSGPPPPRRPGPPRPAAPATSKPAAARPSTRPKPAPPKPSSPPPAPRTSTPRPSAPPSSAPRPSAPPASAPRPSAPRPSAPRPSAPPRPSTPPKPAPPKPSSPPRAATPPRPATPKPAASARPSTPPRPATPKPSSPPRPATPKPSHPPRPAAAPRPEAEPTDEPKKSTPEPSPKPAQRETHERTQVGPPPAAPPLEATRVGPPPSSPAAGGAEAPSDDDAEDAESAEARARRLRESWPWIEEGNEETTRVGYLPEAGADDDGKTRVALTPPALSPVLRARVAALAARLLERGRIEHEAEALQLVVRVGLAALEELDD